MRKTKIIVLMLIMLLLTIIFPLTINASDEYQINPDRYKPPRANSSDVDDMYKFGGSVAGVIQIAGTIVSVGALIVIGIRYVVGSAEERSEYKERMLPYIIGAVLLFGASNIVKIIYMSIGNNYYTYGQDKIQEIIDGIDSGEIDVSTLTNEELKNVYIDGYIAENLYVYSKMIVDKSLEEIINEYLKDYEREVYYELKDRKLLKPNGIELKSYEDIQEIIDGIENGELDINFLTDKEIKDVYINSGTHENLFVYSQMNDKPLEEIINEYLKDHERKIYYEVKARGLLKEDGMTLK